MGIEMGRVSGPLLSENLLRNGEDLAFETDLLYLDVNNRRIGIKNDSPSRTLAVVDARTTNLVVDTQADIANFSILTNKIQHPLGSIYLQPNQTTNPTIKALGIATSNLQITNQKIENIIFDSNIEINPNGTGIVKFISSTVNIDGTLHATGNVTWDGTIVFGNNSLDNVTFNTDITSDLLPDNSTYGLGSLSKYWKTLYSVNVKATNITSSTEITVNDINLVLTPGKTIYVSTTGNDNLSGVHAHAPYKSLKVALANAVSGDEIVIFPGTYTEIFPLTVPQGVSIRGMDIRNVIVKPTTGTNTNNAFLLNGETTVSFLTVKDFYSPGNGFSFASNFTITSRSPYVYNVTVITASTTSPGSPGGSAVFTSSPSQYLSIPNNAAFTQNQPFTIECWYYPTSTGAGYIWAMLQHNFLTLKWLGGQFQIDMSYVGFPPGYSAVGRTYSINTWYHIALSWDGTNGWLFINGVIEATFTGAGATVADGNPLLIGQYQGQGQPTPLGNITNFRVVKGTAVYTVPFTPPTTPLTAIAGTQLLLLEDTSANLLKDSSANNLTITNNGTVTWAALSPVTSSGSTLSAGNGALVDGSLANSASTSASMLFNAVTMIVPDVIGIQASNGSRVEWLNSFTYFANKGIYLTDGTLGFASQQTKYGAELRSINSANIYGTFGAVADGASTKGYLSNHNFSYIGLGRSSNNDTSAVLQENETVATNGAILYYDSIDQNGDFRIGNIFYVNQQTGQVIFNAQHINFGATGGLVFETEYGITNVNMTAIQTGNIRIQDNNIDSLIGPVNILAASTNTYLNTNVFVTGLLDVTGDTNVKGNVYLGNDVLDTVTIFPRLTQTFKPKTTNLYTLGTSIDRWKTAFLTSINVDNVTQITNNTISTLSTDTDLKLVAAGTGKLQITTTDVAVSNSITIDGTTTINGDTSLRNTEINGSITLTGDIDQLGNIGLTGTLHNTDNILLTSVTSFLRSNGVKILDNQIFTATTNDTLTLYGNGNGGVVFDDKIKFTNTTISNRWTLATTNLQKSIVLLPNGIGNTIVNSTKDLTLPYSNISTYYLSSIGEIRQNSTTNLYEGYNIPGGLESFSNLYDTDRNTFITPELTPGSNDNTLRFGINGIVVARITPTYLFSNSTEIDNIHILNNTITTATPDTDFYIVPNNTASININNLVFKPNQVLLDTDQILTMQGTDEGYFKFGGTSGLVIPSGTNDERRLNPIIGETRFNTELNILEIFNGTIWDSAVGSAAFATPEEVDDIMNTWAIILG